MQNTSPIGFAKAFEPIRRPFVRAVSASKRPVLGALKEKLQMELTFISRSQEEPRLLFFLYISKELWIIYNCIKYTLEGK